jgi:hypothetical protein
MTRIFIHNSVPISIEKLRAITTTSNIPGVAALYFKMGNIDCIKKLEDNGKIFIILPRKGNVLQEIKFVLNSVGMYRPRPDAKKAKMRKPLRKPIAKTVPRIPNGIKVP